MQRSRDEHIDRRCGMVIWTLQAVLVFLAVWTGWLQLACSDGEKRRHRTNTVRHEPQKIRRGTVTTRDGLLLAHDVLSWRIGIDPVAVERAVRDNKKIAAADKKGAALRFLQRALHEMPWEALDQPRDLEHVERLATDSLQQYDEKRRLRYVRLGEIFETAHHHEFSAWYRRWRAETGISCFNVSTFYRRDYPQARLGRQLLGEVGPDGHGQWGLELVWDEVLSGREGMYVRDRAARRRFASSGDRDIQGIPGAAVRLTLDSRAQQILEQELLRTHEEWQAEMVLGVVMVPDTGAVRALASTPLLDHDELESLSGEELVQERLRRRQRITSYQFEPGSTIKPVILSQVYLQGMDTSRIITDGRKRWRYRGRTITDSGSVRRPLSIEGAVVRSSNIGMAKLGLELGMKPLRECLGRFGFGELTGIGLSPKEWAGGFTSERKWSYYSTTGIPFGYEISTTLLQLARAYCAMINGGSLVEPHIVESCAAPGPYPARVGGSRSTIVFPEARAEQISKRLRGVMRAVVAEGTGTRLRNPSFGPEIGLAGKTGTAYISDGPQGYTDQYRSSFAGFAPFDRPEYLVIVVVVRPQGEHYGGRVAGPAVRRVLGALLGAPDPERGRELDDLVGPAEAEVMYDRASSR